MNPDTATKVRKMLTLAGLSTFDGEALSSLRAAVRAVEATGEKWTTWVQSLRFNNVGESFVHEQPKPRQSGRDYRNAYAEATYNRGDWFSNRYEGRWDDEFSGFTWAKAGPQPEPKAAPETSRKDEEKIARWEAESRRSSSKRFFKGF